MIKPSKEAIERMAEMRKNPHFRTEALLREAYAIDFAQLEAERDQLRQDLKEARDAIERVNRSLPQQTIDQLRLALQEARGSLRAELEATQIALQESQQRVKELEEDNDKISRDYELITQRANELEALVGNIAMLLRNDMED